MFTVPGSSDPPSTPDRRSFQSHPSTTPAGPPPSNRPFSFTPKGPPPSSVLGSSQFGSGGSKQPFSTVLGNASSNRNGSAWTAFGNGTGRRIPPSSPPQAVVIEDDSNGSDEDEENDRDAMEEDQVDDSLAKISPGYNPFNYLTGSTIDGSPRGSKRSRAGDTLRQSIQVANTVGGLDIHGIAKGLAAASPPPRLDDSDELILETERIIEQIATSKRPRGDSKAVAEVTDQLVGFWKKFGSMDAGEVEGESIGPSRNNIAKANFVSALLLPLHHPPTTQHQELSIPKVLLDWLDNYHNPGAEAVSSVLEYENGYSESPAFWDAIYLSLNRGRIDTTLHLLRGANFAVAASEDNPAGYSGQLLRNIEQAVDQAISLLEDCPAVSSGNWEIKGPDWTMFRHRVEQTIESLRDFAEHDSRPDVAYLQSSIFGLGSHNAGFSLSQASRRAESNVPFEVYEPLQDMYNQLLGQPNDILKSSFDWVEAAIALTAWWDGEEADNNKGSLAASRRSLNRSQRARQIDVTPNLAYRQKLVSSLAAALEEEDLRQTFDSSSPMHIALACVFQNDIEALIGILQSWSMPIASAVAELASIGEWSADATTARETVENFDKSDLMVLSYGQPGPKGSKKDEVLTRYANLLSKKQSLQVPYQQVHIEGWQLAVRVLGRLDNSDSAQTKVSALLEQLDLRSNDQVDHILGLCNDLGFNHISMNITERYADTLAESTHRYGDTLLYYTRAHKFAKAKKVVDALISSCLVQSIAYPPENELDDRLKEFIASPKQTFTGLASIDFEAAQRLSTWLSGYATLRRFYNLRDEELSFKNSQKPTLRSLARKKKAAEALLAIVTSANDPIRGGLFDPSTEVVVPVDSLLVLLGEALPLLNQSPRVFSLSQIFILLKAVEDLQTIGSRIYAACEAVFLSALDDAYGREVPSPRAMLRKETSAMTASSQFSMVGSSMLNSQETGTAASEGSGVLIRSGNVKRGWDWRKGLRRNTTGDDVLRVVRLTLSEVVARAWADGEEER